MKVKLGELTKIRTGKLDANASSPDGEYPFFTCSKEPLKISSYSYDCECVLVAGNGDLNVKYYNGKFDAYQRTYIIEDNSNGRLYLPYLYYFMNGYVEELRKLSIGGVIKYIKLRNLTDALIELPDIETQKYIVSILSKIKELIDSRYQELKILENLIKARFIELFGDPLIEDDRYPKVPLGSLAEVGSSKRIFEKEYVSEGIPFYRTKEIVELSKGNRITTELFITKERYDEIRSEYGVPQKGDLLISAVGTIGVIWIVDGKNDFYFKDGNLLRVSATEKFVPEYLKHLLEALISAYKSEMSSGTAYAALTISALKEMMVYDVPHAEQEQFAAFVEQTDKSKLLSGCRLFHSWAPENRDKPKHVGVPQRKTKVLRGGRRQQ